MALVTTLLGACSAPPGQRLLASDLVFFKQYGGWTRTIEIDPWLASHPDLVRHIRTERVKTMDAGTWSCQAGYSCIESSKFRLFHNGGRLVSIVEEQTLDGGGAHPITGFSDYLYDLKAGERIRFGDLFVSWEQVRPLLQREFCEQLRSDYESAEQCPDIQNQAISLISFPLTGKVEGLYIATQDYALGYYAAGRAEVRLDIDPQVYSLLNPVYRDEFEVTDNPDLPLG